MVLRRQVKRSSLILAICSIALLLFSATAHAETKADCNSIHSGPCTRQAAGRSISLEINPRPVRHMTDLTFTVTVTPCTALPSILILDLSMPGMYMGKNQVTMRKKSDCTWEGKGLIVRCMSGRKLWQATILSNDLGNPAFSFDVRD